MAIERFADEKADFHPRTWLTRYRRTSIGYMTKMLLFYHGIGFGLMLAGDLIVQFTIPDYEQPSIPRSLSSVLAAGPLEETIFFGIPFYIFGNAYSVLVTGSVWVAIHLLNTDTFEISGLAFGNLLFVLPSLFFSLRTWISGKGWFSILTHSSWNGIFFGVGCTVGEFPCSILDSDAGTTIFWLVASAGLIAATYALYRRKESKERPRLAA